MVAVITGNGSVYRQRNSRVHLITCSKCLKKGQKKKFDNSLVQVLDRLDRISKYLLDDDIIRLRANANFITRSNTFDKGMHHDFQFYLPTVVIFEWQSSHVISCLIYTYVKMVVRAKRHRMRNKPVHHGCRIVYTRLNQFTNFKL